MVAIILGDGFEEMEAIVPCDMLRRAGIQTVLAGIGKREVTGSRGICVKADTTVEELAPDSIDMIVLPGGLGGVESILNSSQTMALIQTLWQAGRFVAAICAAPTVLAKLGITDGVRATCYPGMEEQMGKAIVQPTGCAVQDGQIITATAAGTAYEFACRLISALKDEAAAQAVARAIVL